MEIKKELTVTLSSKDTVVIYVLDIIKSSEFRHDYVLYLIDLDDVNIYASILKEEDDKFELSAIEDDRELDFIKKEINKYQRKIKSGSEE